MLEIYKDFNLLFDSCTVYSVHILILYLVLYNWYTVIHSSKEALFPFTKIFNLNFLVSTVYYPSNLAIYSLSTLHMSSMCCKSFTYCDRCTIPHTYIHVLVHVCTLYTVQYYIPFNSFLSTMYPATLVIFYPSTLATINVL